VVVSLVVHDGRDAMRALQRQVGRTEPFTEPDLRRLAGAHATAGPAQAPERALDAVGGSGDARDAREQQRGPGDRSDRAPRHEPRERGGRTRRERGGHDRRDGHARARAGGQIAGTVASYDPDRGFGFISRRGASDVFVHVSAIARNQVLEPGQRVRFELAPGRRGQQARNVQPVH
jgi:cold shock CspA family protein